VKKLHNLFVIKDIKFFFFLDDNYASTVAVYIQVPQYYKNNKAFDQCNNKYGVPFEKKIVFHIFSSLCLKNRSRHMRLSRLLSKHSADVANTQKSKSVNHFNLCATIWKVRTFEGILAIRNSGKKSATDQKQWQISKNDLSKFDS
jgi:hypothetical protein